MIVRKLRGSDLAAALEMYKALIPLAFYQEDAEGDWDQAIADEIATKERQLKQAIYESDAHVRFLVAVDQERVLGAIAHYPVGVEIRQVVGSDNPDFEGIGELGSLYVQPECRNQGVASRLIRGLMLWLKADGVDVFALDSGFTHAIPKWLKKFGTPYCIAKNFWGEGKDHYVWRCKVAEHLQIDLNMCADRTTLWDFLQRHAKSLSKETFAYIPANIHFDATCCTEDESYYNRFYQLTLQGEVVALVMFETIEDSRPTGYWDWILAAPGNCYRQLLAQWLVNTHPGLETTMAFLNEQWLYEGLGWHLGSYGRYVGIHGLQNMPEDPTESRGVAILEENGVKLVSIEHSLTPETVMQKQIADLIGMATSGALEASRYLAMSSPEYMPPNGKLSQWAAIDVASERVVGYVAFWLDEKTQRGALEPIACDPEWRGKGIGKALAAAGLWQLKRWGCETVTVSTSQGNHKSQGLYKAVGFERTDWLATYQKTRRKKRAIVFDFYGTLVDIETDESQPKLWQGMSHYYNAWGSYTPQTLQNTYLQMVEARTVAAKRGASQLYQRPVEHVDIELLEVFRALFPEGASTDPLGNPEVAALLFRSLSRSRLGAYNHAAELLDWLGAKGYRRILLSNAQTCFTEMELSATSLADRFDSIFLSSNFGLSKPESAYFEQMLLAEQLTPEECLFVGNDHLADLGGANAVGMQCVYLHTSCSQAQVPDWLPAYLLLMDGDLSRLLQYFQALEAPHNPKEQRAND